MMIQESQRFLLHRLHRRHWRVAGVILVFSLSWLAFMATGRASAAEPAPTAPAGAHDNAAPLCRFGVNGVANDAVTDADLGQLRVGWFQRYTTVMTPTPPADVQFAQTIRLKQTSATDYQVSPSTTEIAQIATANPGSMWLIGNEPDRRYYQDDLEPQVYATAYHDLYMQIKAADPTARILAGSIVQATEVRLRYLDMVLAAYRQAYGEQMPVDAWSIHGFVLNEVSCERNPDPEHLGCSGAEIPPGIDDAVGMVLDPADTPPHDWIERNDDFDIFAANIVRFRQWMAKNGYRQTPLLLSEYGVLIPSSFPTFTTARVNAFMNRTFDYLLTARDAAIGLPADDYRLVQRLSWFSTTDQSYNGFLFWPSRQLTAMGRNYQNYTAAVPQQIDFTAVSLHATPATLLADAGPVTVTLTATIGNAGNLAARTDAVVRFYNGDPTAGGQQIGADTPLALSGCGDVQTATVVWPDVAPGDYALYAVVSTTAQETNSGNNTAAYVLIRVTDHVMLPAVSR